VEARSGGLDGRSRRQAVHGEREALALAQRWRDLGGDGWKDISPERGKPPGSPTETSAIARQRISDAPAATAASDQPVATKRSIWTRDATGMLPGADGIGTA
jgi:hypothetical protein